MLVDSHCHLQFKEFDRDRDGAIQRAKEASVSILLCVGIDVASSRAANTLAQRYPIVYSGVGCHPHHAKDFKESIFHELREISKRTKVVAIGEIGLDYYRNLSPKEDQKRCFGQMLILAQEFRHPILLHIREAYPDTIQILKESLATPIRGVNHCFSGTVKELKEILDLGLFVSFAGNVTYPKSESLREAVRACPLDRMLIETDAPYLAPQSYRGKRNEPAYLRHIATEIATLKGIALGDVESRTSENALSLFPMSRPGTEQWVYAIGDTLYVNVTNACSARCTFCELSAPDSELYLKGYRLKLKRDPSVQDVLKALNGASSGLLGTTGRGGPYQEVVFCGYGEPTLRIKFLVEVARALKEKGVWVRLDTNGHGNLIHRRSIVPDLAGLVDEVSVSLNAENDEKYNAIVRPHFGVGTYEKVKEFVLECKKAIPKVVVTFVELPEIDVSACRKVAERLGVEVRFRKLDVVG